MAQLSSDYMYKLQQQQYEMEHLRMQEYARQEAFAGIFPTKPGAQQARPIAGDKPNLLLLLED